MNLPSKGLIPINLKNTSPYDEQLKDKLWIALRNKVKARDKYKCVICDSTALLHVHHKHYLYGKLAWEYPLDNFITVCASCHKMIHDNISIHSFFSNNVYSSAEVVRREVVKVKKNTKRTASVKTNKKKR